MKRFRALAGLLSCLAVLAGGFMTVAAAAVPSSPPVTERSALGEPCSHCDDCGGYCSGDGLAGLHPKISVGRSEDEGEKEAKSDGLHRQFRRSHLAILAEWAWGSN